MAREPSISRRRWIQIVSGTGVAGLAGCNSGGSGDDTPEPTDTPTPSGDSGDGGDGGDGDGGDGSSTDTGSSEVYDKNFHYPLGGGYGNLKELQYNPFNPKNFSNLEQTIWGALTVPLVNDGAGEYAPVLLDDWEIPSPPEEDSVVTLKFDTESTWSNGDPITARDYVTQQKVGILSGTSSRTWVKEYRYVDDETAELVLNSKVNPHILQGDVLAGSLTAPHSVFKSHLQALQDAQGDEDAVAEAKADLLETRIDWQDAVTSGPWKIDQITDTDVQLAAHEGHPAVGEDIRVPGKGIDWDSYTLIKGEGQGVNFIKQDKIEATRGGTDNRSDKPSYGQFRQYFQTHSEGFTFNFDHDIWGRMRVRHAFGYLFDRIACGRDFAPDTMSEDVLDRYAEVSERDQVTGLANPQAENWYDDETLEIFRRPENNYQSESGLDPGTSKPDREKAAQLLRDEGFEKRGGNWYTPDGEQWEVEIPAFRHWETHAKSAAGQLRNFGVKTKILMQESTTFFGKTLPNGEFGIATGLYACCGDITSHPHMVYDSDLRQRAKTTPKTGLGTINMPEEVKVPTPIGNRDYDGGDGWKTVNIVEKVDELGQTNDSERASEIVKELSWVVNWQLPVLPARHFRSVSYMTHDHWKWPEEDGPYDMNHPWWGSAIQAGMVQAKTKDEPTGEVMPAELREQ